MAKELTWNDIYNGMSIKNPMEQQLFFLSRFFNIPHEQIQNMIMSEIYPMIKELNIYMEELDKDKNNNTSDFKSSPDSPIIINPEEPVKNRWSILDL